MTRRRADWIGLAWNAYLFLSAICLVHYVFLHDPVRVVEEWVTTVVEWPEEKERELREALAELEKLRGSKASIRGTPNQIVVTNGHNSITLDTMQPIYTHSRPEDLMHKIKSLQDEIACMRRMDVGPDSDDEAKMHLAYLIGRANVGPDWCPNPARRRVRELEKELEKHVLRGTGGTIEITHGVGTITLDIPQVIDTKSNPTFKGATIDGDAERSVDPCPCGKPARVDLAAERARLDEARRLVKERDEELTCMRRMDVHDVAGGSLLVSTGSGVEETKPRCFNPARRRMWELEKELNDTRSRLLTEENACVGLRNQLSDRDEELKCMRRMDVGAVTDAPERPANQILIGTTGGWPTLHPAWCPNPARRRMREIQQELDIARVNAQVKNMGGDVVGTFGYLNDPLPELKAEVVRLNKELDEWKQGRRCPTHSSERSRAERAEDDLRMAQQRLAGEEASVREWKRLLDEAQAEKVIAKDEAAACAVKLAQHEAPCMPTFHFDGSGRLTSSGCAAMPLVTSTVALEECNRELDRAKTEYQLTKAENARCMQLLPKDMLPRKLLDDCHGDVVDLMNEKYALNISLTECRETQAVHDKEHWKELDECRKQASREYSASARFAAEFVEIGRMFARTYVEMSIIFVHNLYRAVFG